LVILLSVALLACAAPRAELREHAEALFATGDFDGAMAAFEEAARASPEDEAARAGARRSREAWVAKTLMDAKAARDRLDPDRAVDLVETVLERETGWGVGPSGAVAAAQETEVAAARDMVQERVRTLAAKRHHLAARTFLEQRKGLFSTEPGMSAYQVIANDLAASAASHCDTLWLAAGGRTPFFADFALRWCRYWGVQKVTKSELAERRTADLASSIDLNVRAGGLTAEEKGLLRTALEAALRKTPWYDPGASGSMAVDVLGGVVFTEVRATREKVHPWVERVTWTEMVTECDFKQVPRVVVRKVPEVADVPVTEKRVECDPVTKECREVTAVRYERREVLVDREVTDYVRECVQVTRPVERHRDEPRRHRYQAYTARQRRILQLDIGAAASGRTVRVEARDRGEESAEGHDEDRTDIGLPAAPASLPARASWLVAQFGRAASELASQLVEAWKRDACEPAAGAAVDVAAERVFRCLRATRDDPPAFVRDWFVRNLGATVKDVVAAVGF
jgi:hypothetical protein